MSQKNDSFSELLKIIDTENIDLLQRTIQNSKKDYIHLLEQLVAINTQTNNLEGSKKITQLLKTRVEKSHGFVELFPNDQGIHFVARFKGDGTKTILVYAHTDTVTDSGSKYYYDEQKDLAFGQGTADCKGSVAFTIKLIEVMLELDIKPYKEIILYLDAQEETGSKLGREISTKLAKEADIVFQADTGRPNLGITTKRKATGFYSLNIEGISGHAGNGAHATASAVSFAGYLITQINQLASPLPSNPLDYTQEALESKGIQDYGQFIPENTINPVIYSTNNNKANVVTDQVRLDIDLRCFDQKEYDRIHKEILCLVNQKPPREGLKVSISGGQKYQPLEMEGSFKKAADLYIALGKKILGKDILSWQSGGVTPGNIMAEHAPTMLDSVGVDAEPLFEHSPNELLFVSSYTSRMLLGIKFFETVEKNNLSF